MIVLSALFAMGCELGKKEPDTFHTYSVEINPRFTSTDNLKYELESRKLVTCDAYETNNNPAGAFQVAQCTDKIQLIIFNSVPEVLEFIALVSAEYPKAAFAFGDNETWAVSCQGEETLCREIAQALKGKYQVVTNK